MYISCFYVRDFQFVNLFTLYLGKVISEFDTLECYQSQNLIKHVRTIYVFDYLLSKGHRYVQMILQSRHHGSPSFADTDDDDDDEGDDDAGIRCM